MKLEFPPLNMLLRNGKVKLQFPKCQECNEFYAHKRFKYKCSGCYGGLKSQYPWKDEEFRNKVNEWAQEKMQFTKNSSMFRILKQIINIVSNTNQMGMLHFAIESMKEDCKIIGEELYISAEYGEELLRRTGIDCPKKSHIICPLVLDWWNMKNYDYKGFELCYYGRFGDEATFKEKITSIPPPPPHKGVGHH